LTHEIRDHQNDDEDAGKQIVVFINLSGFGQPPIIECSPRSVALSCVHGPIWNGASLCAPSFEELDGQALSLLGAASPSRSESARARRLSVGPMESLSGWRRLH